MLYFAYGSNLNRAHFATLCPAARPVGPAVLPGHRLVFRRFADVEPDPPAFVPGALWRLSDACLAALDRYEGVGEGLYRRVAVAVARGGAAAPCGALSYRMNRTDYEAPDTAYLAVIAAGYRDWALEAFLPALQETEAATPRSTGADDGKTGTAASTA